MNFFDTMVPCRRCVGGARISDPQLERSRDGREKDELVNHRSDGRGRHISRLLHIPGSHPNHQYEHITTITDVPASPDDDVE